MQSITLKVARCVAYYSRVFRISRGFLMAFFFSNYNNKISTARYPFFGKGYYRFFFFTDEFDVIDGGSADLCHITMAREQVELKQIILFFFFKFISYSKKQYTMDISTEWTFNRNSLLSTTSIMIVVPTFIHNEFNHVEQM